jgi:hypothetical protein
VIEGMKAAKAQGAICSFDLNYRAKLWATMGGLEKAQQVGGEIASLCDVLVGNEEDLQLGLVRMHSFQKPCARACFERTPSHLPVHRVSQVPTSRRSQSLTQLPSLA